jgi:hypothetical protein
VLAGLLPGQTVVDDRGKEDMVGNSLSCREMTKVTVRPWRRTTTGVGNAVDDSCNREVEDEVHEGDVAGHGSGRQRIGVGQHQVAVL